MWRLDDEQAVWGEQSIDRRHEAVQIIYVSKDICGRDDPSLAVGGYDGTSRFDREKLAHSLRAVILGNPRDIRRGLDAKAPGSGINESSYENPDIATDIDGKLIGSNGIVINNFAREPCKVLATGGSGR